jgi:hypothetical protein
MPADYLSRLPGAKESIASISAFNPFQADLYELQMKDEILQGIQTFRNINQWPPDIPKQDQAYYTAMIDKLFQDKKQGCLGQAERFQVSKNGAVPTNKVLQRGNV